MKTPPFHIFGLVACLCLGSVARGEGLPELLREAQAAYLRGDMKLAKENFTLVNRMDPRNAVAIGYLKMIAAAEAKQPQGAALQKQLEQLIIPKVDFREATLGSALDFLKQAATKHSEGKVAVNFVIQLPPEMVASRTVTLNLVNVPMSEVLRYLGGLVQIEFSYEKYAILVKPRAAQPAAPAAVPPAAVPEPAP